MKKNTPNTPKERKPKNKKKIFYYILIITALMLTLIMLAPYLVEYFYGHAANPDNIEASLNRAKWIRELSTKLFYSNFIVSIPLFTAIFFIVIPIWITGSPTYKSYQKKTGLETTEIIKQYKHTNFPSKKMKFFIFLLTIKGKLTMTVILIIVDALFGLFPSAILA